MELQEKAKLKSIIRHIILFNTKSGLRLKNLGYLPRWVILLLDTFIVFVSGIITYFLFKGVGLKYYSSLHDGIKISVFFATNIFFFWWFKTYSGIIRHSSFIDAIKLFFAQFSTFLFLIFVNLTYQLITNEKFFITTGLFVNIVISFCFLFLYRVLVKQFFEVYIKNFQSGSLANALVYGSDANAISVANALNSEVPVRFRLMGFIDKYNSNSAKRILDLPIINHKKKISVILRSLNSQALILADKSLSKEEQLAIVDECLENNVKVYTVPIISDWANQTEISKKIKSFEIEDLLDRKPIVLDQNAISKQIKDKTILITGAAGSIGSEIVRQVLEFKPKQILLVDQAESPLHDLTLELNKLKSKIKIIPLIADIKDKFIIENIFDTYKPNLVYHAAAYKHVPLMEENPFQAIQVNILGTKIVADLSVQYNVERFVMVSTDKAVNPSNVMGASKRIAEKYVQSLYFSELKSNPNTTKFITTRFGNVLGSNGSVVPLFTKQIAEGGPVTITHKDIIRYFMTIPEACQLVLEAGAMGVGGEIYIFDMGKPVKIYDLAKKMIRLAGFVPDIDIKIKIVGLRPGEKLFEELLNDSSKTLPTHHNKIMIAQEIIDDFEKVKQNIENIFVASKTLDNNKIVAKMKIIVPEYISKNSIFEVLDN